MLGVLIQVTHGNSLTRSVTKVWLW